MANQLRTTILNQLQSLFESEEKGEEPFSVHKQTTFYLSSKSNFYKFLKSWFPKKDLSEGTEIDFEKLFS